MKIFASTILLFFVLFLGGPTIVVCLEKDSNSIAQCEDCNSSSSSSIEEIKHDIKYYTFTLFPEMPFFDSGKGSGRIIFENLSKHDLISASIFLPPPNMV